MTLATEPLSRTRCQVTEERRDGEGKKEAAEVARAELGSRLGVGRPARQARGLLEAED